ncbi:MAG: 16S rRNA (uracil(1498)-N(3))-methyltransferase [Armatimonadetes bacterium]|nr:16S rRNA (uracil(1498)-N(3))-methyltransferase [Armatimonadota bacterium]
MDREHSFPLRALPRAFVLGLESYDEPFELPQEELDKFRKVLRLQTGEEIAILPGDGRLIRCRLEGRNAIPLAVYQPNTESPLRLTVLQSLPKADKIEEIVRACTEIGVAGFVLFHSERTVVRWDEDKMSKHLRRLAAIAREACEVSFRTMLPSFSVAADLAAALAKYPEAIVLSESENTIAAISKPKSNEAQICIGPEGGWTPAELELIGKRGVTLGPRVLRVDHAAAAAASILLLG